MENLMNRFPVLLKLTVRATAGLTTLVLVAGATYLMLVQPWHLRWGATRTEAYDPLPGDATVPDPAYQCTHALTIDAPAEQVWPWLIQIGQDRAGFYSYDWLERWAGMEVWNSDRIVPLWQSLEVGDTVGLTPRIRMEVVAVEKDRRLVFDMRQWAPASWAFILEAIDCRSTRLVIRMRIGGSSEGLYYSPFDPGHFIMERKMMLRIKELSEGSAEGSGREAIWFGTVVLSGLGVLILLLSPRWPWSLLAAAVATVLWGLLFFMGYPSPLLGLLLVVALAGTHFWAWRQPPNRS
jgi:hypothetical protein